jgi:EAL domain-containing protein (putative c-di-GMP-specific phosphodiesterase class I)
MLDYNNKQCDIHLFAHLIAANAVVNHNSLDNDEQTVSQQIENFFASIDFNQRHDYIYRHQEKDGATVLEINPFVNNHALIHCYFEYDEIEQEDDITYDEKEIQTINLQHIAPERVKVIERIEGLKKYINDYKGVGVIGILISNINTHPLLASEIHQRLFNTCGDECFMIAVEKDRLILVLYQLVQKNTLDSLVNDIKAALDDEFAVEGHLYKVQAVFSHYLAQNYEETSEQILDIVEQKLEDRKLPFVRFTAEILDGISNHQFILFYQPIVDIQKGVISGFEALIRWNHPDRGLLLPAEFLFDIEQAGLGKIIGRYVIARAMAQLARWQARSQNHEFFVSINLTKELMQEDDFIAMVQSIGQSLEISLKNVHFEITEHHMLENSPLICSRVVQLKQLGCGVGLDDFGTGYSSLNAIVDLPINWVKIDRELIHDIAINERKALIVQKVLELTTLLGLRTIAEGVEDFATVDILKKADCKFIQGFIFGKPLPPEKAFKLLESMNFTPPSEIVIETDKQISNSVF